MAVPSGLLTIGILIAVAWVAFMPARAAADGGGCTDAQHNVQGTSSTISFTAPSGGTIDGICIKSGNDSKHSGRLGNGTFDDCYQVSGVGSTTATVTKLGVGPTCQEISHIDIYVTTAPSGTPTATPTAATPTTTTLTRLQEAGHVVVQTGPNPMAQPLSTGVLLPARTGSAGQNSTSLGDGIGQTTAALGLLLGLLLVVGTLRVGRR
jgi:hypothetical protein